MRRLVIEQSQGKRLIPVGQAAAWVRKLRSPDGLDLPQPSSRDQSLEAHRRARELKVVDDRENPTLALGDLRQLARSADLERHRLLEQHVFTRKEIGARQRDVRRRRGRDRDRVDVVQPCHRVRSLGDRTLPDPKQRLRPLDPRRRVVDHSDDLDTWIAFQPGQVPVRPDPPESHHRHP